MPKIIRLSERTRAACVCQEGTAKFAGDTRTVSTLQSVRKKSWVWNAGRPRRSQSVGSVSFSLFSHSTYSMCLLIGEVFFVFCCILCLR